MRRLDHASTRGEPDSLRAAPRRGRGRRDADPIPPRPADDCRMPAQGRIQEDPFKRVPPPNADYVLGDERSMDPGAEFALIVPAAVTTSEIYRSNSRRPHPRCI